MDTSDHVDLMRELAGSTAGTGTSQNKNPAGSLVIGRRPGLAASCATTVR